LAAAWGYLMIHNQDPVGLITFDEVIRESLPARSKRTHLGNILSLLARAKPAGTTAIAENLRRVAAMIRHRSLIMIFSDLLADAEPIIDALHLLRHGGHDVILFHVLDEAEVTFPFKGMVDLKDPETGQTMIVDAPGMRADYQEALEEFRSNYLRECQSARIDYVPLDTSQPFDKALVKYLSQRRARF
ncbi:MAG: DUF58 domain-containing protein, partial [Planctomycetes bacterium]|nr:DUF58 domain-containing protein [Planctomycetota bacterium]